MSSNTSVRSPNRTNNNNENTSPQMKSGEKISSRQEKRRSIRFQEGETSISPVKQVYTTHAALQEKDAKLIEPLLNTRGETAEYSGWLELNNNGKLENRILVIGQFNIFCLTPQGKLSKEAHFLELQKIENMKSDELKLVFSNFDISGKTPDADSIIQAIRTSFDSSFFAMPPNLRFKIEIPPSKSLPDPILPPLGACGGFNRTYNAFIDYYQLRNTNVDKQNAIRWDIDNIFESTGNKNFDFNTLNIPEYNFRLDELLALLTPLHFNSYFRSLTIKRMKLEKEVFLTIAMMLRLNNNLEDVVLVGINNSYKEGFITLAESLQQNQQISLRKLNLSSNIIEDKGLEALSKNYFSSTRIESLNSLELANCAFTKVGISIFAESLLSNPTAKSISILDLSKNVFGTTGSISLAKWLEQASNLTYLRLSSAKIKPDIILQAVEKGCPKIKEVDISYNSFSGTKSSSFLVNLLKNRKIQQLDLSGTLIPYNLLADLLEAPVSPLSLNLRENKLRSEGAKVIAQSSLANITSLDLSENSFKNEGLQILAAGLQTNTTLKKLNLDKNSKASSSTTSTSPPRTNSKSNSLKSNISSSNLKSNMNSTDVRSAPVSVKEGIQALSRALNNSAISSLSIVGSSKRQLKQDIIPLLGSLAYNSVLTELNISGNQMGDEGVMELARALQVNKTLVKIELDNNSITTVGFVYLKNALYNNQTVSRIPFPVSDFTTIASRSPGQAKDLSKTISKIEKLLERNAYKLHFKAKVLPANKLTIRQLNEYNEKLQHIIEDRDLALYFREFLHSKHSNANLSFWLEVEDYRRKQEAERKKRASEIYEKYFTPNTEYELSRIDKKMKSDLEIKLNAGETNLFDEIQEYIWAHMVLKLVPKFLISEYYEDYKEGNQLKVRKTRGATTFMLDNFQSYMQKKKKRN